MLAGLLVWFFFPLISDFDGTVKLQGREENVLFCCSELAFVVERSSAERNKNEAFSAVLHWKCFPTEKRFFFLHYRFVTLWDIVLSYQTGITKTAELMASSCIRGVSGVVVCVVVSLSSTGNGPLSGVCSVVSLKYLSSAVSSLLPEWGFF